MRLLSHRKEKELQLILETTPSGILAVDDDGRIALVNAQIEKLFGYGRDELIGRGVEMLVPERLRQSHVTWRTVFNEDARSRPMGAGRDLHGRRKDGTEFPVEIGLNAIELGGRRMVIASVLDVTERKRAEEEIRQKEARLRLVIEATPNGILTVDAQGRISLVNPEVERMFGYRREELIGQPVEILVPLRLRHAHHGMRAAFAEHPETRPMGAGRDLFGRRKDGTEFPVEIGLNAVRSPPGGDVVLATIVDITERKVAQERQHLLTGEILHRTKNLMAVIQSIANKTLTSDRSIEEARETFLDRLLALGKTNSMLIEQSLEGVALKRIVEQELAGFSERVDFLDCDLFLRPSAAQDFALLVHELATNATKHGALSAETGHVSVSCVIQPGDRGRMRFSWRETGGPKVTPPRRRGFGINLLERVGRGLGESVELTFDEAGLRYELTARLESLAPVADQAAGWK